MPEINAAPPGDEQTRADDAMLTRAESRLSSFDPEQRTVDVVLATETPVRRRTWDVGVYDEILVVNRSSIDTSRLESMALVDSHDTYSGLESRIGSVLPGSLRFEGNTAIVTAKLSRNPKGDAVFRDLEDGHTLSASVGYRILAQTKTEAPAGGTATIRATKWLPVELSIVSLPADPNASTRSIEGHQMPDTTTTAPTQTRAERNGQIRSLAKSLGLQQRWIDEQIDSERTADEINAAALAAVQARTAATGAVQSVQVGEDHSDPDAIRTAMGDALAHRLAPGAVKLEGRATEFRSYRILDMVADMAAARGERVNARNQDELLERAVGAHSSSDLPKLLSAAANKALLGQYAIEAPTYRKWAARKPFVDFKAHQFLRIGDFPAFKEIKEAGSVKYGSISENAESVTAKEYGSGVAIGRRALINDDLSALSDFSSTMAIRAANDENKLVYGVLIANGALSDSVALFHGDHANLPTAGALADGTLGAAILALRSQKSLDGMQLNLSPAYLVVGPALEVTARKLLTAVNATKTSDINPWANVAELVVDANLGATEYYLFASPSAAPVIVWGYVGSAEGPQVRSERDFDTQAVKVAASLDFAVGAIDFRGAVKNAGA